MLTDPNPHDERTGDGGNTGKPVDSTAGPSDSELITAMVRRDQSACGALYDRYSRLVFSVAFRVTSDRAVAEDIVHDLFLQLWRTPEKFDNARGQLAPWLAVMARNRSIDWLRRQKVNVDPVDVVLTSGCDTADEVERAQIVEKVRGILKEMPEAQRDVLELAFFGCMTHADIATKTGAPLGTIKSRIRAGLMMIRRAVQS